MALPASSLSIALQAFADFLDGQFGEDVVVMLDSPQKAAEAAKASDKAVLNAFTFRVAPSGFHADATEHSPLFVRAHLLLTCFPPGQGEPPHDTDLRVIGHAMAVLHSTPTIPPVLPGTPSPVSPTADPRTHYRLHAVLQVPQIEELNHIWTMQGGELAYRLSTVYELALIPVEPLAYVPPASPVVTAIIDLSPSAQPGAKADGSTNWGIEPRAVALTSSTGLPPPTDWAPVQLFAANGEFTQATSVPPATPTIPVALAGPRGSQAILTIEWKRKDGTREQQAGQVFELVGRAIDTDEAVVTLQLDNAAAGDFATIFAHPATADHGALAGAPPGNTLTLRVED